MKSYNLGFISDADIYEHVKNTVKSYRNEITLCQFNESIVDPIKLTFDSKVYGKSIEQVIEDECFRQIDKSNGNRISYFHQNLFKYSGNGWEVPKEGFDVENRTLHIFAELKNKHNTMNSASSPINGRAEPHADVRTSTEADGAMPSVGNAAAYRA